MIKTHQYLFLVLISLGISLSYSCQKSQAEKDREIIEDYIAENNLSAVQYETSGLFYVIEKPGGSTHPNPQSDVTVSYAGKLIDGTQFDNADTVMLNLSQTIYGWQLGVPLIGEGGEIKLLIPSAYGYGTQGAGIIPKNAVLIFDIDLILYN